MKKNILFVLALLLIFSLILPSLPKRQIFAKEYPYAKITNSNTTFYKQPVASVDNALFILEKSYFVKLLENEKNGFYKAEYMDEIGYIAKSDLIFVKGTPQEPYANNINFRVFAFEGLNLRSSPVHSQGPFNVLETLPFLETNLIYYGKAQGEEAIPQKGTVWYYCKYYHPTTKVEQKGYVYSIFCDLLPLIKLNTEDLEVISTPIFEIEPSTNQNDNTLGSLPKNLQIIIVLAVSLPCLAIIYFLFKPTKIALDNGKKKKKIKKVKNADYFEFED